ncbi:MAG: phenylalanine--tRNA ligase beta subunit-related protein [Candidatus Peregrinibacteria bacterium]
MNLNIDKKIFEENPNLKIGVILIREVNNIKRVSDVEGLLRGISAQRGREFAEKDIHEDHFIRVWDYAYGKFGINPRNFHSSLVALLRMSKEGREIPHTNALVDICNYYSLKHLIPIGALDVDWLYGDLELMYTKGGEAFRPADSIEVQDALLGEIAYLDKGGIISRYWNHGKCERTKITQRTVTAAFIVEDLSKMHMDQFGKILRDIENGIYRYIGGEIESHILTEENSSLDFGVNGRQTADDSKIPKQEKAYFMRER